MRQSCGSRGAFGHGYEEPGALDAGHCIGAAVKAPRPSDKPPAVLGSVPERVVRPVHRTILIGSCLATQLELIVKERSSEYWPYNG